MTKEELVEDLRFIYGSILICVSAIYRSKQIKMEKFNNC